MTYQKINKIENEEIKNIFLQIKKLAASQSKLKKVLKSKK